MRTDTRWRQASSLASFFSILSTVCGIANKRREWPLNCNLQKVMNFEVTTPIRVHLQCLLGAMTILMGCLSFGQVPDPKTHVKFPSPFDKINEGQANIKGLAEAVVGGFDWLDLTESQFQGSVPDHNKYQYIEKKTPEWKDRFDWALSLIFIKQQLNINQNYKKKKLYSQSWFELHQNYQVQNNLSFYSSGNNHFDQFERNDLLSVNFLQEYLPGVYDLPEHDWGFFFNTMDRFSQTWTEKFHQLIGISPEVDRYRLEILNIARALLKLSTSKAKIIDPKENEARAHQMALQAFKQQFGYNYGSSAFNVDPTIANQQNKLYGRLFQIALQKTESIREIQLNSEDYRKLQLENLQARFRKATRDFLHFYYIRSTTGTLVSLWKKTGDSYYKVKQGSFAEMSDLIEVDFIENYSFDYYWDSLLIGNLQSQFFVLFDHAKKYQDTVFVDGSKSNIFEDYQKKCQKWLHFPDPRTSTLMDSLFDNSKSYKAIYETFFERASTLWRFLKADSFDEKNLTLGKNKLQIKSDNSLPKLVEEFSQNNFKSEFFSRYFIMEFNPNFDGERFYHQKPTKFFSHMSIEGINAVRFYLFGISADTDLRLVDARAQTDPKAIEFKELLHSPFGLNQIVNLDQDAFKKLGSSNSNQKIEKLPSSHKERSTEKLLGKPPGKQQQYGLSMNSIMRDLDPNRRINLKNEDDPSENEPEKSNQDTNPVAFTVEVQNTSKSFPNKGYLMGGRLDAEDPHDPYFFNGQNQDKPDVKIETEIPLTISNNTMLILTPIHHHFHSLQLMNDKHIVLSENDYEVRKNRDGFFYVKVRNVNLFNTAFYYKVQFSSDKNNVRSEEIPKISVNKLKELIPELKEVGLTKLADSLEQLTSSLLSPSELSQLIQKSGIPIIGWSRTDSISKIPRSNRFYPIAHLISEEGYFCGVCRHFFKLTDIILSYVYNENSSIGVSSCSVYPFYLGKSQIRYKDPFHVINKIKFNNIDYYIDSTPLQRIPLAQAKKSRLVSFMNFLKAKLSFFGSGQRLSENEIHLNKDDSKDNSFDHEEDGQKKQETQKKSIAQKKLLQPASPAKPTVTPSRPPINIDSTEFLDYLKSLSELIGIKSELIQNRKSEIKKLRTLGHPVIKILSVAGSISAYLVGTLSESSLLFSVKENFPFENLPSRIGPDYGRQLTLHLRRLSDMATSLNSKRLSQSGIRSKKAILLTETDHFSLQGQFILTAIDKLFQSARGFDFDLLGEATQRYMITHPESKTTKILARVNLNGQSPEQIQSQHQKTIIQLNLGIDPIKYRPKTIPICNQIFQFKAQNQ